jgi:hypothetical protein
MNVKRLALAAALLGAVVPVLNVAPADAGSTIKITRIHYKQTGTNLNTEYIVFKNTTGSTIQMKNWKIISKPSSDDQFYVFPRTAVGPGKTVTLFTGIGTNSRGKRYWDSTSPRWDDQGDRAVLKNAKHLVIDTCQYAGGGTTAYC